MPSIPKMRMHDRMSDVSLNEKRRHLTTDQRAAIAADLANLSLGSNRHGRKLEGQNYPSSAINGLSLQEAAVQTCPGKQARRNR